MKRRRQEVKRPQTTQKHVSGAEKVSRTKKKIIVRSPEELVVHRTKQKVAKHNRRRQAKTQLSQFVMRRPTTFSHNAALVEDATTLSRTAKRTMRAQKLRAFLTRGGKYRLSATALTIVAIVSLVSLGFAFFSDMISKSLIAQSGCIQETPELKIDGQAGDRMDDGLHSAATCIPLQYTQVEYVTFNDTQYVDTGYDQLGDTATYMDFQATGGGFLFGSRMNGPQQIGGVITASTNASCANCLRFYYGVTPEALPNANGFTNLNSRNLSRFQVYQNNQSWQLSGGYNWSQTSTDTTPSGSANSLSVYIGGDRKSVV
jgi:hypothetical protein